MRVIQCYDVRARDDLLDRIRPSLVCPSCKCGLDDERDHTALVCRRCGLTALRKRGAYHFRAIASEAQEHDWLNALKAKVKHRAGRIYPLAIAALSPVYRDRGVKSFVASFGEHDLVCDLGSGTTTYDDRVVCVDGFAYDPVNVVCDLAELPFADGSLDGVISQAVLEHVPNPAAHVAEMLRVLRPGGRLLCFFPFMQPFHASPYDYQRLTIPGLQHLFGDFTAVTARPAGGPTSGMLWTLQEWLAMVGSLGSERVYRMLVPVMWALSPLKYLDAILIHHPAAHVITSGFSVEATKPASS
jgi:SAM-dependent methyltransferase